MSLKHALLGFLNYHAYSGYDLKNIFDRSVQHFWSADQSQIYRTLAQIADDGLAEVEVIAQSDRPNRKVYHITEAGHEELLRWLAKPIPTQESRSAALILVFFAGQMTNEEVLPVFEQAAEFTRMLLERYRRIPPVIDKMAEDFGSPRDAFFWGLTLELGVKLAEAQLDWAESVIHRIKAGSVPPAAPSAQP